MSGSGTDATGQKLKAICEAARQAHPELALDEEAFGAYVRARGAGELDSLEIGDLYLAWACSAGQPKAHDKLEAAYFASLKEDLRRRGFAADVADEVMQQVRSDLLAPTAQSPKILQYSGRGQLLGWLRVVALRTALNAMRGRARRRDREEEAMELLSRSHPEMRMLKETYAPQFNAALKEAVAGLPPRERLILKQFAIDGLSAEALAALHGVHRGTAFRWLAHARTTLAESVRRALSERLKLSPEEVRSILRLVRSRLDLTLGDDYS